jgi:hypothetical protein
MGVVSRLCAEFFGFDVGVVCRDGPISRGLEAGAEAPYSHINELGVTITADGSRAVASNPLNDEAFQLYRRVCLGMLWRNSWPKSSRDHLLKFSNNAVTSKVVVGYLAGE